MMSMAIAQYRGFTSCILYTGRSGKQKVQCLCFICSHDSVCTQSGRHDNGVFVYQLPLTINYLPLSHLLSALESERCKDVQPRSREQPPDGGEK